ncbi:MAG: hypothetical protein ACTTI5_00595 [Treponema sp.]
MKKLSKNTFAKLFATFLGASTILTPLVTIVSCQPISKSPIIKQTEKQPNKDNKKPNPGTPDPKPNPGTPDPKPNPGTSDPTDPLKDIVETTGVDENNQKKYILSGSFNIDDIKKVEEKINNYGETPVEITSLNINCFSIKTEGIATQSAITTMDATPSTISYVSKTITPTILKDVLKLKGINNYTFLKLNNKTSNGITSIPFESTIEKPFDISDLARFTFSDSFKLADGSKIILGSTATKKTDASDHDITPHPKVHELLKLLNNEKLKDDISVKDVYITGNVKDLLPLLVEPGRIKEVNGGIKFLNVNEFRCPGPNVTEYDGGKNNTKSLPVEQLIEFHKRTNEMYDAVIKENARSVRLFNLVLENVNTKEMSEEQLKFIHFKGDFFSGNILFKNSNLSKIDLKAVQGQTADTTFEEVVLPRNMMKTSLENLTLKNVIYPKEEFNKSTEYNFTDLPYNAPKIRNNLTIYGDIKDSPLKDLTQEQIEKLKNNPRRPHEMPGIYKGSQEIYDRLKYIYRGESHTKEFGNLHGSIQKPQDTFLALLGNNNSRG